MSDSGKTASTATPKMQSGKGNIMLTTALIGFFLGALSVASLVLVVHGYFYSGNVAEFALGMYLLVVHVAFHMTEFVLSAAQRPHNCHPAAFMLYHSKAYTIASLSAIAEFLVEAYLVPDEWKAQSLIWWWTGFRLSFASVTLFTLLTAAFYGIRVVAMAQCGPNFSLMIEDERRDDHVLVDTGLYRYLRHPAYFGWFWRTACAQLILANPVSVALHTGTTWVFFKQRIPYEEGTMARDDYFGEAYRKYQARSIIGIPLISTSK